MNNEDRDLLINDYLDGLLAGEQLRTFESELESDSELREEVAVLRELLDQAANLPVGIERTDPAPRGARRVPHRTGRAPR